LAAPVEADVAARIPAFQAADIFTTSGEEEETPAEVTSAGDSIYGAEVDGEVAIKMEDFPMAGADYDEAADLEVAEVEGRVRQAAPFLAQGAVDVASLPYVDPARFDTDSSDSNASNAIAVAITPENVSLLEKTDQIDDLGIEDKMLQVTEGASLRKM